MHRFPAIGLSINCEEENTFYALSTKKCGTKFSRITQNNDSIWENQSLKFLGLCADKLKWKMHINVKETLYPH